MRFPAILMTLLLLISKVFIFLFCSKERQEKRAGIGIGKEGIGLFVEFTPEVARGIAGQFAEQAGKIGMIFITQFPGNGLDRFIRVV